MTAEKKKQASCRHNKTCACVDCGAVGEPMAMWRKYKGKEIFMGIVHLPRDEDDDDAAPLKLVKLNDPEGELDGPGHLMDDGEFLTECHHYNPPSERKLDIKENLGLMDFSSKPSAFYDSQEGEFHVKYPFGTRIPQVRNGDSVRVVKTGKIHGIPFVERFWVQVLSLTSFGVVTGISMNTLNSMDVKEDDLVAFPITCVVGMKQGQHWR